MALAISAILYVLISIATTYKVSSETLTNNCPLDIQIKSVNYLNRTQYAFEEYLLALSKQANQTGQIFLDSTRQQNCLDLMKRVDGDFSRCGIEKLTRGDSRCSNYSVIDVNNKMGHGVINLAQDCRFLRSGDESDETCGDCLKRWEETDLTTNNDTDMIGIEADICKFSVLVAFTSSRVNNEKWIKALYKCIGKQSPTSSANAKGEERKHNNTNSLKRKRAIGLIIGGLVVTICILIGVVWVICWKTEKTKSIKEKSDLNYSSIAVPSSREITLKDVYYATNDLNESNFIGQGIAGKVYKGVLPDGQHIAVKHIGNDIQKETFVREVQSLSLVKHPNLVTLIGHSKKENECFLIYELCHNGNLAEWLLGKEKNLTWSKRLEIALDCARGLLFLHTYPQGCIVHRDIKPTNILLCADFHGKLSDFGLSKVMNMGQSFVSSEVRGTFGYVDPEYQQNHRVNASGDVYSFGIVLLQLLSGQRVINLDMNKPMTMSKMAKALTKSGDILEFADPKLNGEYSDKAFELVLKLALSCSGKKQQRPTMKQVVSSLERALDLSAMEKFEIPVFSQD